MNPDLANRPILLVEDNPADLDLTLRAFRRHRLVNPVEVARDGEEALDWLPRWQAGAIRPLVVLLDLRLPKHSGLEVLQRIREEAISHDLPVVMLTTSREDSDIRRAYELGANSYIVKPVEFDRFLSVAAQIKLYWCALNEPPPAAP